MPVTSVDQEILKILNRDKVYLILQKVNTKHPYGNFIYQLRFNEGNPSNLDGDNTLDKEEVNVTNNSEEKLIDKTFILVGPEYTPLLPIVDYIRTVIQAGVKRTGDTDGNVYITKAILRLGYADVNGNFTQKKTKIININFFTNSTDYQLISLQAWFDYFSVPENYLFALNVQLYGKKATTESGKMKLCFSRGSFDSYVEF